MRVDGPDTYARCHTTPRLASASPELLALNVPTLQADDMPLPHGQNNKFNILCALGRQAAAGRRTQWVAQQLPAASVRALPVRSCEASS